MKFVVLLCLAVMVVCCVNEASSDPLPDPAPCLLPIGCKPKPGPCDKKPKCDCDSGCDKCKK